MRQLKTARGKPPHKRLYHLYDLGPFSFSGNHLALNERHEFYRPSQELPQIREVSWSISLLMSPSHPAFPKGCVSCLVGQLCSNSRQRGIFLNAIPLIKTACTLWLKHIRIHSEAWRLATSLDLHFQFDYRPHPSSEQRFDACTGMQWEALQGGVAENRLPRTQEFKSLALLFKHRVLQN